VEKIRGDKCEKKFVVAISDAVIEPYAVVVKALDTLVARRTVFG